MRRDRVAEQPPSVKRMLAAAPALAAEGLSKTDAARRLGVGPATFTSMMHRHLPDLEWHDGRGGRKKRRARR